MKGFTLMELMVAMVVATIVTLSASDLYGRYHRSILFLQKNYLDRMGVLVADMYRVMPYYHKTRNPGIKPGL